MKIIHLAIVTFMIIVFIQTSTIASGGGGGSGGSKREENNSRENRTICGVIQKVQAKTWSEVPTAKILMDRFGNKFPIAMVKIRKNPKGEKDECPIIKFGDRSIPACSIIMFLKVIKWPLYLKYIIWCIMEL